MKATKIITLISVLIFTAKLYSQPVVKILFDASSAQTAGNADWVIDADANNLAWNPNGNINTFYNEANAQRFATSSQSLITASTSETFWTGGLSNWGIDCVKKGYVVETLPYNGLITYGNASNPQDLSNYKVFIVDEPNIIFSSSEKTAMMNFVLNGGGLFLISDHTVSDRNNDGNDSPVIWNDFISNNGVLNNGLGFSFDLADFSQTSSNIPNLPNDSILHGPMGNVTQVMWANGTSITLTPSQNSSVKGVVYKTGSNFGNANVMCAYARVGNGKVAALGDSSPTDDGTGDPNDVLYNGYTGDASGNHQRLIMNITIWLAKGGISINNINENTLNNIKIYPNPVTEQLNISTENNNLLGSNIEITDLTGRIVKTSTINEVKNTIDLKEIKNGFYILRIQSQDELILTKKITIIN